MLRGMKSDNDNERDTFSAIGLAAALILNRLSNNQQLRRLQADEKKNEDRSGDTNAGRGDEQKSEQHRRYVDEGLKRLAMFERRAKGIK